MHRRGLIHRDIKPENLLMADDNTVMLCDFDLSIDGTNDTPVSKVGTPDYVAPEVLRDAPSRNHSRGARKQRGTYTDKVDIWAVGVLAWEMVAGAAPFAGATAQEVQRNVCNKLIEMPQHWPPDFANFVAACLSQQPHLRPAASDLLKHDLLRAWASSCPAR
eukprot:jgi/Ulvmu1/10795/UM069_0029.1